MKQSRRDFITRTVPAALLAAFGITKLGCESERTASWEMAPEQPVVNEYFTVRGNYIQQVALGSTDPDVGINDNGEGVGVYTTAGFFTARGYDDRRDTNLEKLVAVRHSNQVSRVSNESPQANAVIPAADWKYFYDYLDAGTQGQIADFENNSTLADGTIISRGIDEHGLFYLVDGTTLANATDTTNSGNPDYVVYPSLTLEALNEVIDQGHETLNHQQGWNVILQMKPENMVNDPIPNGICPLPGTANIQCDYVFDWLNNGLQKTMGVALYERCSPEDLVLIATYKTNNPVYRNPDILLINPGTKAWQIRKAMAEEIANHNSN